MRKSPDRRVPGLCSPLRESILVSYAKHTTRYDELTGPVGSSRPYNDDELGEQAYATKAPAGDRGFWGYASGQAVGAGFLSDCAINVQDWQLFLASSSSTASGLG